MADDPERSSGVNEVFTEFRNTPENFLGGKIALFFDHWKELFSDFWLLNHVLGIKVNFEDQNMLVDRKELTFPPEKLLVVKDEITKLLNKNVIKAVADCEGQVVSNVFVRAKKDGTFRMILNLKKFNECIEKIHFKMEMLSHAVNLMKQDCYFGSIDLKDAYYSVNISEADRKFFRFRFQGILYEFCGLPQGFKDSPRLFTKILRPVLGLLREKGHHLVGYIDDFLLQGEDKKECSLALKETGEMFDYLGFTVHPVKSVFVPTQEIEFLGFILNSVKMEVSVSLVKAKAIKDMISEFLGRDKITIRDFAKVIGCLVALDPGVWVGPIFWRRLELDKAKWLKIRKFDFDKPMTLSDRARQDLLWWLDNLDLFPVKVVKQASSVTIMTDASEYGWGAVKGDMKTGGCWLKTEMAHINVLELKAVLFGLKALCDREEGITIKILSDNSTTISCINRMGSSKEECNEITRLIWMWCLQKDIKLLAVHLPGVQNTLADYESRKLRQVEWMIRTDIFDIINVMFGPFDIDLFASRLSKQIDKFMSWLPDPEAVAINALDNEWNYDNMYCFPPFILIPCVLRKLMSTGATVTLIAPHWEKQAWYPRLMKMLTKVPVLLPNVRDILINPITGKGIEVKLRLMACTISGRSSESRDFRKTLETSFVQHGGTIPERLMPHLSNVGSYSVSERNAMPWILM